MGSPFSEDTPRWEPSPLARRPKGGRRTGEHGEPRPDFRNARERAVDHLLTGSFRNALIAQDEVVMRRRIDWFLPPSSVPEPMLAALGFPDVDVAYCLEHESSTLTMEKLRRFVQLLEVRERRYPGVRGLIIAEREPQKLIKAGILEASQLAGTWTVHSVLGWTAPLYLNVVVPRLLSPHLNHRLWRFMDKRVRDERDEAALSDGLFSVMEVLTMNTANVIREEKRRSDAPIIVDTLLNSLEDFAIDPAIPISEEDRVYLVDRYLELVVKEYPNLRQHSPLHRGRDEGMTLGLEKGLAQGTENAFLAVVESASARGMEGLILCAELHAPTLVPRLKRMRSLDRASKLLLDELLSTFRPNALER